MSADISVVNSAGKYILIEGEIAEGDYEKFVNSALEAGSSISRVFIASRGGDSIVAMRIGRLIRSLKYATEVPNYNPKDGARCFPGLPNSKSNCLCLSSCVLIYLSGVDRRGEFLGIHRTFINHEQLKNLSLKDAEEYSKNITSVLGSYLTEMGAPNSLLEKIESISSQDIELLENDYISKHLSGYTKSYQEWIIAKCGKTSILYKEMMSEKDDSKQQEKYNKYKESIMCSSRLIRNESEAAFYPTITQALSNSDKSLIPRRSLMQDIITKTPFDLTHLIGKKNYEAIDLLSLIGMDIDNSKQDMREFISESFTFNKSMSVGFDSKGRVYSVDIPFRSLLSDQKAFNRHFLDGLNKKSTPKDFARRYGTPSHQGCYPSGVCFLIFTTNNADLKITFNKDKALQMVGISKANYWDRLYKEVNSSKLKKKQ